MRWCDSHDIVGMRGFRVGTVLINFDAICFAMPCWHAWNLCRERSLQRVPCQFSKLFDNIEFPNGLPRAYLLDFDDLSVSACFLSGP